MLASLLLSAVVMGSPNARSTTWIPLVKLGPTFNASWKKSLETAAEVALKRRRRVKMQEPPAVSLDDTIIALGCAKWGDACANEISSMMGAQFALIINVKEKGDGATIQFRLVGKRAKLSRAAGPYDLPDRADEGRARAIRLVRAFVDRKQPTELHVTSTPSRAIVAINGKTAGKTPLNIIGKYKPGNLKIEVRKKGRVTHKETVVLEPGASTTIAPELQKPKPFVAVVIPPPDAEPETTPDVKVADASGTKTKNGGAPDEGPGSEAAPPVRETGTAPDPTPASGDGVSGGGVGSVAPVLFWTGAGLTGVAAVGALASISPWLAVVGYGFATCTPDIKTTAISFQCDSDVPPPLLGEIPWLSWIGWVGGPVGVLVSAAGLGLLFSGILLEPPLEEGPETETAMLPAGLLPRLPNGLPLRRSTSAVVNLGLAR